MMDRDGEMMRARMRAPRAGAIAGIVFSVLLGIVLVLVRRAVPDNPMAAGTWLAGGWQSVRFALGLVPFAGLAFPWFLGVLRDQLGVHEERCFATVFLGSALPFLALLFAAAAGTGALIMVHGAAPGQVTGSGLCTLGRVLVYEIVSIHAMERAGVFARWLAWRGFALGLLLPSARRLT